MRLGGVIFVATLLMVSCGQSQRKDGHVVTSATEAQAQHKGQIIAITDSILMHGGSDTIRFGHMRSGEIAVKQLWVENKASKPVVILSIDRTCGCTTIEFENQPIRPSQIQQLKVTFDSRGIEGWQLKVLRVNMAGGQKPLRIFVEAEVK